MHWEEGERYRKGKHKNWPSFLCWVTTLITAEGSTVLCPWFQLQESSIKITELEMTAHNLLCTRKRTNIRNSHAVGVWEQISPWITWVKLGGQLALSESCNWSLGPGRWDARWCSWLMATETTAFPKWLFALFESSMTVSKQPKWYQSTNPSSISSYLWWPIFIHLGPSPMKHHVQLIKQINIL